HVPGGDDRRPHREPAGHRLPRRGRHPARRAGGRRPLHRAPRTPPIGADVAPRDLRRTPAARRRPLARGDRQPAAPRDRRAPRPLMALLAIRGLVTRFLGVTAVDQVALIVEPRELSTLIRPKRTAN